MELNHGLELEWSPIRPRKRGRPRGTWTKDITKLTRSEACLTHMQLIAKLEPQTFKRKKHQRSWTRRIVKNSCHRKQQSDIKISSLF
jgi:hypothetical protein